MLTSLRKRSAAVKDKVDDVPSHTSGGSGFDWDKKNDIWDALCSLKIPKETLLLLPKTKFDLEKMIGAKTVKKSKRFFMGLVVFVLCMGLGFRFLHSLDGGAAGGTKQAIRLAATRFWVVLEQWGAYKPLRTFDLNYAETYPELKVLEENFAIIRKEAAELEKILDRLVPLDDVITGATPQSIAKKKAKWTTFFLQFDQGETIEENAKFTPRTAALLKDIPSVYTAFFSVLTPGTHLSVHWGYFKGFVRFHLGIIVPNNNEDKKCWIRFNPDYEFNKTTEAAVTEGDRSMMEDMPKYYWKEGEGVMFDDNYIHEAKNEYDANRIVLFVDVTRKLPWYAHIVNKIMLFVAMRDPVLADLKKSSIVKLRED